MPEFYRPPASPGADPSKWLRDPMEPSRSGGVPGRTLLMDAAMCNDEAAVRALLPVSDPLAQDAQERTAWIHASNSEVPGTGALQALMPVSAVDHIDSGGMTALMYAVMNGQQDRVNLLWPVVNRHLKNKNGYTLLMLAAWSPNNLAVMQKVAPLCDPNAVSHDRKTVLHHTSDPAMMAWLLDQGLGDPSAQDQDGNTPLMALSTHATFGPELLALLTSKSDLLATNKAGLNALELAVNANRWRNAAVLALAMPVANVLTVLAPRLGKSPRSIERRVIEAERAALSTAMSEGRSNQAFDARQRSRL